MVSVRPSILRVGISCWFAWPAPVYRRPLKSRPRRVSAGGATSVLLSLSSALSVLVVEVVLLLASIKAQEGVLRKRLLHGRLHTHWARVSFLTRIGRCQRLHWFLLQPAVRLITNHLALYSLRPFTYTHGPTYTYVYTYTVTYTYVRKQQ